MALVDIVGGKDSYLNNKLLDHVLGGGDYTRPSIVYVALYTALSPDGLTFTEATGGGYARKSVTNNATNFPAAVAGVKRNGTDIGWAAASADVGGLVGAAIYDAASSGNRLYWGPFGSTFTWLSGQTFTISANTAVFTER